MHKMDDAATCEHTAVHWYLDPCTEAGWRCLDCAEQLGYRPDLDRSQTYRKVSAMLHEMHEHQILYVSSGSAGDLVAQAVAQACRCVESYDQSTIARLVLEHAEMEHTPFWRDEASRWLAERANMPLHEEGAQHSGA